MALTRFQILLTRGAKSCYQTRYDHQPFRGWSNIVCGIAGDQRELRRRRLQQFTDDLCDDCRKIARNE